MMRLSGKKSLVVGLRRTGVAAARFLANRGARVTVTDKGDSSSFAQERESLRGLPVEYALGSHRSEDFISADLIVVSPGVPLSIPEIAAARERGAEVICELELAARFIAVPIVAISGTNGKSTVTSLIGEMLKRGGRKTFVGGNIGNPLLNLVNSNESAEVAVVEVSSFQLEGIESFRPHVAVMLNITPDHLDRYPDMEAYIEAKARIFLNQNAEDWAVVNGDDEIVLRSLGDVLSRQAHFSIKNPPPSPARAWARGSEIMLELSHPDRKTEVVSTVGMKLEGAHNLENAVAAAAAARLVDVPIEAIEGVLKEFTGLAHRVQFVREVGGARYYDDSKGTNVGAVEKSLVGFNSPVVLIAGGLDKGGDFTTLRPLLKERARALVLMGAARNKMTAQIGDVVPTESASDMKDAVERARRLARPGDVILLSPACASFDMFRSYAHRGDVFQQVVREITE